VVRSIVTLVMTLLVAGSSTAHAHHLRKQVPANDRPHSFARNVHRQASAVPHRKNSVSVEQHIKSPLQPLIDFFQKGLASIWGGGPTSDGKHVRPNDMACAHRTLPLGTVIRVTHERTRRSILVTVRDRGPYKRGRILDLTPGAARVLGFGQHAGIARVTLNIVRPPRVPEHVIYD
jgi:rare lipoprotein A